MSERVLVGYATGSGTTAGVAEAIGRTLTDRGFTVDVKPLGEVSSLSGYDGCVLGSAINGGRPLPGAVSWVESNASALAKMPVAAFCVHGMNGGTDEKQTRRRLAYLDAFRAVVKPTAEGFFVGTGPTFFLARWVFKAFGGTAKGDSRDWDAIRAWAEQLAL